MWQWSGAAALTWAGRLDFGLVLFGVRVEEVWGRVLATLHFALKGVQTLDVLFFERAGCAARRAHVQVGSQLPPLLVLVHLVGERGRRWFRKLYTKFFIYLFLNHRRSSFWSEGFTSNSGGSPGVPGWGRRSLWRICRAWRDRGAYGPQQADCSCPWLSPQQRPSIGPPKFSSLAPGQARTDGLFSHWWWWKSSTSVGWVTEENCKNEKKGGQGKKSWTLDVYLLGFWLGSPVHFVVHLRSRIHFLHAKLWTWSHSWENGAMTEGYKNKTITSL